MYERLNRERHQDEREGGFTLIELLVVIAILGILAAIVVFSVAGITDKGQLSACKIDTQTLQTAEEAYFAKNTVYASTEAALQSAGFLSTVSTLHGLVQPAPGAGANSYYLTESSATCGASGDAVGGTVPAATSPAPSGNNWACGSGTQPGNPATSGNWGDC